MNEETIRKATITEIKQHLTDFYYGKTKEEKDAEGNIKVTTQIPSLRRKLRKAITHDTVIPTADKWFRDFQIYLSNLI